MSPELLASIKQHEGLRLKPYKDTVGALTVGYGHNLEQEITLEEADVFLLQDVTKAIRELDRAFKGWKEHSETRQNVLIEMAFNMGAPRLATFRRFWYALSQKDYQTATQEMLDSQWARQVGQRARTLAARMETDSF